MPLIRERLHTRSVEFNGYRRSDGLWDIEAELKDSRHYDTQVPEKGFLPAGEALHHMTIVATLDDQLVVKAITARMLSTPFTICSEIQDSLQAMEGAQIGAGWRRAVSDRLGEARSCTHLRELLVNLATAALQTIPTWHGQQRQRLGLVSDERPLYLGQCHAWRVDGPVVRKHLPQFHQPATSADDQVKE